jgi:WS/DGAT/MGAT family acyltransferase
MGGTGKSESAMELLSGVDGVFLNLETPATPMHVGSLHLFETPPGYRGSFYSVVRRMMESRMVPVLRRRLAALPLQLANPVWLQGEVDLDEHIRRVRVPAPGTWSQLEAVVAGLHAELLDRSRPLWMIHVFDGLEGGARAYYFKIHHAMLDGQAGVALAGALFDTSPDPAPRPKARARVADEYPGTLALAAVALRHDAAQYIRLMRELPGAMRTLAAIAGNSVSSFLTGSVRGSSAKSRGAAGTDDAPRLSELRRSLSFGPRTAFNVAITPERGFATASLPRAGLKAIAAANNATVNDVVLALCSGALRRYLRRTASIPRKSLIAAMPISLREPGNTEMRTQAMLSLVSLATNVADPVRRLQAIRDSSGATKAAARGAKSVIPTDIPLLGAPWLLGALAALYGRSRVVDTLPVPANVLVSNVPGPPVPLYVGGLRMSGYWPLSIVEHGVGLNITLIDYAGTLFFGFVVARNAVPDSRALADDFLAAFAELQQCVQKVPKVRTALAPAARRKAVAKPAASRGKAVRPRVAGQGSHHA